MGFAQRFGCTEYYRSVVLGYLIAFVLFSVMFLLYWLSDLLGWQLNLAEAFVLSACLIITTAFIAGFRRYRAEKKKREELQYFF